MMSIHGRVTDAGLSAWLKSASSVLTVAPWRWPLELIVEVQKISPYVILCLARNISICYISPVFRIAYSSTALKSRRRLPADLRKRLSAKIEALARDRHGRQPQVRPLKGLDAYRLRVGDWRVLYELDEDTQTLVVLDIRKRKEAYR